MIKKLSEYKLDNKSINLINIKFNQKKLLKKFQKNLMNL